MCVGVIAAMRLPGFILSGVYLCTPALVAAVAAARAKRARSVRPALGFLITCFSGLLIGAAMAVVFAVAVAGHVKVGQILLTAYFATAALCLLKGLSWLLER